MPAQPQQLRRTKRRLRLAEWSCGWLVSWALVLTPSTLAGQSTDSGIPASTLQLLADHCFDCHGPADAEAGLNLAQYKTLAEIRGNSETWKKVMRRIMNDSMPPPDFGKLAPAEKEELAQWIDHSLHQIDCATQFYPGQVTIRRLNRQEYRYAVLDLLKYDYEPATDFPGDDTGYGFDNIGDVLSLPPVLLEKYLDAAESISRAVIKAPEDVPPAEDKLPVTAWTIEGGINTDSGTLAFYSQGEASYTIPGDDVENLTVRVLAKGQQAGDEPVKMSVFQNGRKVQTVKITSDDQQEVFEFPLKLTKSRRLLKLTFDNDFYDPKAQNANQRDRNLIVEGVTLIRPASSDAAAASPLQRHFCFVTPNKPSEEAAVARQLLAVWSSRFFRRPSSTEEVERLLSIYDGCRADGASHELALQTALQAILVSPKFLYKVERPVPTDGQPRDLNSFELATNLSFFLWRSTPDHELLQTALKENLQDPQVLRRTVAKMLASDKADRLIENFSIQWLQLRGLSIFEPDQTQFPGVDQTLLQDMQQETVLFCRELMREDRSLLDFLEADFTYVNSRLAAHYGLPPSLQPASRAPKTTGPDDGFTRISLQGTPRGGLLTQGSILAVTSNPGRTSPVKRGKWIMENLLGEPPPPALPDVMPLEQQELTGTLRERMEQHRRDPACASCHAVMDQLGFALENFNAVGQFRTMDEGAPIDAAGVLPEGTTFSGAADLRAVLATKKKEQFVRCVTEKMLIYALGRGLRYEDQCAVNEITARLAENNYRFSELVLGVVESRSFRQRQRDPGESSQ